MQIYRCFHTDRMRSNYVPWVILLTVMLFAAAVRLRLLAVPLERDEGEYAYAGQLILQGIPPYAQVYSMKMPGVYGMYALIMTVFGQTCGGIHLGLLVVNVAAILLMFLLGKKLFGQFAGVAAATAFALLSLGQRVFGIFAHTEHFVIFFVLSGILLLLRFIDCRRWPYLFGGALLLGLSFLMKQHAAVFILFAGLYLLYVELSRTRFMWKVSVTGYVLFFAGVLLPFAAACLVLWRLGVFEKFWFFTFSYSREYALNTSLLTGLANLKNMMLPILSSASLIWILAAVGLTALWWNNQIRQHRVFITGFLVFSFLAICPGLYFREHYFILLLPPAALLAGIGFTCLVNVFARSKSTLISRVAPVLLSVVVLLHTIYQQWDFFFTMVPAAVSYKIYYGNPFPESLEIAKFIKDRSSKDDYIAIIGSEPQIYFYSGRRSATGYIYTYPLMENQPYAVRMQKDMIREIEAARPKFLVFVNVNTSWLMQRNSEKMIFNWFKEYRQKYYQTVGIIDIPESGQTVYRWGSNATGYSPRSKSWLSVAQRKD